MLRVWDFFLLILSSTVSIQASFLRMEKVDDWVTNKHSTNNVHRMENDDFIFL